MPTSRTELFGVTLATREADPLLLLRKMREHTQGLAGFRLFHDHDARVSGGLSGRPALRQDRAHAAIRLDSYVSLKIAGETGQWRLGDMRACETGADRLRR